MVAAAIFFEVTGEPKAWARSGHNGKQHYTPGPQRGYGKLLKDVAAIAMRGRAPFDTALELCVTVKRSPPKGETKARRLMMLNGEVRPTGRPDWDNFGKLVGDALNGVCWTDDAIIVTATVRKIYAEIPGINVAIYPLVGPPMEGPGL